MKPNVSFAALLLLMTLSGCQKEEIESNPQPYNPPTNPTEYAYFTGILRDETSLQPLTGVGIGYSTGSALGCGQSSDTTDQNGRFFLSTCRTVNSEYFGAYPDNIYFVAFDTEDPAGAHQYVELVSTASIQTGDTMFFELYTTVNF